MSEATKRILVLGSEGHYGVAAAYSWDSCPSHLNLADFEIAVFNLLPFEDAEYARQYLKNYPSIESICRLLFSPGAEIVCLGSPLVKYDNDVIAVLKNMLPIIPRIKEENGTVIEVKDQDFAFYRPLLESYTFYFDGLEDRVDVPLRDWVAPKTDLKLLRLDRSSIFATRFGKDIAVALRLACVMKGKTVITSGRLIWLPPPTHVDESDAIDLILQELLKVEEKTAEPPWAATIQLPNQLLVDAKIAEIESQIKELDSELSNHLDQRKYERRFLKLLYESGGTLEQIVHDVLELLGAKTTKPANATKEDLRIESPSGLNGFVEIKGLLGSAGRSHVRQAADWVLTGLVDEEIEAKGILVINAYRGQPPEDRDQPFPDDCIRAAVRTRISMLTTTDLFHAICCFQRDEFDSDRFWEVVMTTDGVCDLGWLAEGEVTHGEP